MSDDLLQYRIFTLKVFHEEIDMIVSCIDATSKMLNPKRKDYFQYQTQLESLADKINKQWAEQLLEDK
jgi:hypothetical protein